MTDVDEGRRQIYVVDDDPVVREMLSLILHEEGYDVICFADGLLSFGRQLLQVPRAEANYVQLACHTCHQRLVTNTMAK